MINISLSKIIDIYLMEHKKIRNDIHTVLRLKNEDIDDSILTIEERGLPGDFRYKKNNYYQKMLARYIASGKLFCENKNVLDTCCGLGWGSFLLQNYAKKITAFDINEKLIEFNKIYWNTDKINWEIKDALNFKYDIKFDVVLAMETIEHFSEYESENYIHHSYNVLKPEGFFIGTSYFPDNALKAHMAQQENKFHKKIFTYAEAKKILGKFFSKVIIVDNWMFIAIK